MITRPRLKRDGRLPASVRKGQHRGALPDFLDEAGFRLAIDKERCRAERRELVFSVIVFDIEGLGRQEARKSFPQLATGFRQRLRITDEIGMFDKRLAVLLPETIASQAARVANDLTEIAAASGVAVSTDIFAWPDADSDHWPPDHGDRSGNQDTEAGQNGESRSGFQQGEATGSVAGAGGNGSPGAATGDGGEETRPQVARIRRLDTSVPTPLWKRSIDIAGASLGLLVLSPVLLFTAVAIRLNSPGPVFFTQWREGKDGQIFRIYKFRTMHQDAEAEQAAIRRFSEQDGPAFKIKNDPRITGIGRYLRKSCADELPQLINVLRGEMSLVGPRPLPVDESLGCSPWHRRRLDVLPGMTCIWQVDGGLDIPFDDWMRMDLAYVRHRNLWTDLGLICKTAVVTLLHRGSV
jgi:lipopolysaccharide/colanic/teichoic acid biosynthesis glycosyltransferase